METLTFNLKLISNLLSLTFHSTRFRRSQLQAIISKELSSKHANTKKCTATWATRSPYKAIACIDNGIPWFLSSLLVLQPLPSIAFEEAHRYPNIGPTLLENNSHFLVLADLDPATAKILVGIMGPFLSGFGFLFILRIVMSWYPKLPVGEFPYVIAYAPTEPILRVTRRLIPPVGGVDVTPVVWFGLLSFLNEILVGPQGLLVLLSHQV